MKYKPRSWNKGGWWKNTGEWRKRSQFCSWGGDLCDVLYSGLGLFLGFGTKIRVSISVLGLLKTLTWPGLSRYSMCSHIGCVKITPRFREAILFLNIMLDIMCKREVSPPCPMWALKGHVTMKKRKKQLLLLLQDMKKPWITSGSHNSGIPPVRLMKNPLHLTDFSSLVLPVYFSSMGDSPL